MTVVRQTAAEAATATGRRRASFHPLAVDEVRRLTDDAIEVTFGVPTALAGQFDYLPGDVQVEISDGVATIQFEGASAQEQTEARRLFGKAAPPLIISA